MPLFVVIYKKREWAGNLFSAAAIIICCIFVYRTTIKWGLRAGPFAEENWYLFAYLFQKPFMKIHSFTFGVVAAHIYMKILDFRRIPEEGDRKRKYPCLNYMHHSSVLHSVMFLVGLGLVLFALLIGHSAFASPYSWSMTENAVYFMLTRPIYVIGTWMILFVFFTGGFTFGKAFLGRAIFRVLGKLAFEAALITPLMIQLIYSQLQDGLFIQFNKVLELGCGNIICVMAASIVLYLLFEFPFKRIIDFTLLPYLSHDEALHLGHVRRKANMASKLSAIGEAKKDRQQLYQEVFTYDTDNHVSKHKSTPMNHLQARPIVVEQLDKSYADS